MGIGLIVKTIFTDVRHVNISVASSQYGFRVLNANNKTGYFTKWDWTLERVRELTKQEMVQIIRQEQPELLEGTEDWTVS